MGDEDKEMKVDVEEGDKEEMKMDKQSGEEKEQNPEEEEKKEEPAKPMTLDERRRAWPPPDAPGPQPQTTASITSQLGDLFMANEVASSVMRTIGDITQLGQLDLDWFAPVSGPPAGEDAPAYSSCLKVTGMRMPFSRVLFKQFLEKPAAHVAPLGDETYWVVDDCVYVKYESEEVARRQQRRIDGTRWPSGSQTVLAASYSTEEAAKEAIAAKEARTKEQAADQQKATESRVQKQQEEAQPKKVSINDFFNKTTFAPRVYFKLEQDESVIDTARRNAEDLLARLIRT